MRHRLCHCTYFRIEATRFSNGFSQVYILITRMDDSTSSIKRTLLSVRTAIPALVARSSASEGTFEAYGNQLRKTSTGVIGNNRAESLSLGNGLLR